LRTDYIPELPGETLLVPYEDNPTFNSTLTVTPTKLTKPGTYIIRITGVGGGRIYYTGAFLTITDTPAATLITLRESGHKLYLHVYDSFGRHIGLTQSGQVGNKISGAQYFDLGNWIAIVLPPEIIEFRYIVDGKYMQESIQNYTLTIFALRGGVFSKVVSSTIIERGRMEEHHITTY